MNTRTITRFVIALTAVVAGLLGTAGAASANPAPGLVYGNPCLNGKLATDSVGVEGCFFTSAVSPGRVAFAAGVFDGRSDGYNGRTVMTVQLLNSAGGVLATYSQTVNVTSGYRYGVVGNSFIVSRTSATYYARVYLSVQTIKPSNGAIIDSTSTYSTYLFTS